MKYVDLNYNKISDIAANEIAKFVLDNYSLIHLSLSNCDLQEDGFLEIATALQKTNVLIYLDISHNFVPRRTGMILARSNVFYKKSQLNYLNVSHCTWEKNGLLTLLASTMNVQYLKCINYSGCKMDDQQAKYLAGSISSNCTLEKLIVTGCELQPKGLERIFDALCKIFTLHYLDISENPMTADVTRILADAIVCNPIEYLNLKRCLKGINSSNVLTAIANNGTLQYLDLSNNDISDNEASCVASVVANNDNLRNMSISMNLLASRSIRIILSVMAKIGLMQFLDLSSYCLSDEVAESLEELAVNNIGLKEVRVDEYNIQSIKIDLSASVSKLIVNRLCIRSHVFSDNEVIATVSLLNNSISITHIDLAYSVIPESKILDIIRAMQKHYLLEYLNLNGVTVRKEVENEFIFLIEQNIKLHHLQLAGSKLTGNFFELFTLKLTTSTASHKELQYLNLSHNTISLTAAAKLSNLLFKLNHLEMVCCGLQSPQFLSTVETLTFLDLSKNPISDQHADTVANLIANNDKLQHINLSECGFGAKGVLMVTTALKQFTRISYLNLESNYLSGDLQVIAENIAAIITNNKDIEYLYLPNCQFPSKDIKVIFEALKVRLSLKCVDIKNSEISKELCNYVRDFVESGVSIITTELTLSQSEFDQL